MGLFTIRSAFLLGASRVIGIDRFPERLALAEQSGAETVNYEDSSQGSALERLHDLTGGRGPDSCIDAVGLEAHGTSFDNVYDKAKQVARLGSDRPHVLREAIYACRKGGTVSLPGVYGGFLDKIPFGAAFAKGLTFKMGQTHVHRYLRPLMERIQNNEIDPSFLITHTLPLDEAPRGYAIFKNKEEDCVKVVLKP